MTKSKEAISMEIKRNYRMLHKVTYGSERWNVLYATQQALIWASGEEAMSPVVMNKKFEKWYSNESKNG